MWPIACTFGPRMRAMNRPINAHDALLALVVASGILIAPIDFETIGLSRSSDVDVGRWGLLFPSLVAGPYILASSPGTRRLIRRGPAMLFGLWLGWLWIGLPFSADPRQTLIALVTATSLWLGVCWFVFRFGLVAFGATTVLLLAFVSVGGVIEDLATGVENDRMDGIAFGFNDLALLTSMGLVWALILHRVTRQRGWLLLIPVFLVPLVGSGARTPAIATTLVVLVLLGGSRRARLFLTGVVVITVAVVLVSPLADRFDRDVSPIEAEESATTLNGRIELWSEVPELVEQRPFVGHGFKSGNRVWRELYLASDVKVDAGHSHNLMLELAVSGGIIGMNFFIAAVFACVLGLVRTRHRMALGMIVLLLLLGLTEAVVEGPTLGLIMFFALSAAAFPGSGPPDHDRKRRAAATLRRDPLVELGSPGESG